jgi:hypothetical protein
MRQWELFGITDSDPDWTPTRPTQQPEAPDEPELVNAFPTTFWTTDATLRITSGPAASRLGLPAAHDLLELFGLDGDGSAIVDAHVRALGGTAATFGLVRDGVLYHCWVSPIRRPDGQVAGTICVGLEVGAALAEERVELA